MPGLSEARLDALIAKALAGEADAAELFLLRRWLGEHGVDLSRTELPGGVSGLPLMPGVDIQAAWKAVVPQLNQLGLESGVSATPVRPAWWEGLGLGRQHLSTDVADPAAPRPFFSGGVAARQKSGRPTLRGIGALGMQSLPGGGGVKGQPLRRQRWSFLATVLLVVLAIGIGWRVIPFSKKRPKAMLTYTTGNGQRANITLSDGSTVALNVASRLDVPTDYAMGNHVLRLHGEALFMVLHHENVPFTVITDHTTATVLGTKFVVRDYATDTATAVIVQDGRVAVHSLILPAGRQVEISRAGTARVRPADLSQFSFATGVLTLTGVPLPAAIPELNRWYGVDIRLGSRMLASQEIAGRLPAGSLTDLTALLELTYDLRVVRNGRVLTLFQR